MNPPAFQFYADDFLAGTLDLSQEEVGAYIRLLCHQWNRGYVPVEPEKQQRLAGGTVSDDVISKFKVCEDGLLRNDRLEEEREKQSRYRAMQSEKGIKSGLSRSSSTERKQRFNRGLVPVQTELKPDSQPNMNSPSPSPFPQYTLCSEGVGEVKKAKPQQSEVPEGFDQFWESYPRRVAKADAIKAFRSISSEEQFLILADLSTRCSSEQWTKDQGKFIPYPASYLRGKLWEDEGVVASKLRSDDYDDIVNLPIEEIKRRMRSGE